MCEFLHQKENSSYPFHPALRAGAAFPARKIVFSGKDSKMDKLVNRVKLWYNSRRKTAARASRPVNIAQPRRPAAAVREMPAAGALQWRSAGRPVLRPHSAGRPEGACANCSPQARELPAANPLQAPLRGRSAGRIASRPHSAGRPEGACANCPPQARELPAAGARIARRRRAGAQVGRWAGNKERRLRKGVF